MPSTGTEHHNSEVSWSILTCNTIFHIDSATMAWLTRSCRRSLATSLRITALSQTFSLTGTRSTKKSSRQATPSLTVLISCMRSNLQLRKINKRKSVYSPGSSQRAKSYKLSSWEPAGSKTSISNISYLRLNQTLACQWIETWRCSISPIISSAAKLFKNSKVSSNKTELLSSLAWQRIDWQRKTSYQS